MSSRLCFRSLLTAVAVLTFALPTVASAQQATGKVQSLRNLGGPTRFTPPVRTVDALNKTMSQPRIQTDIGTVLDKAGLSTARPEVLKALTGGTVMETTVPSGTEFQWMAYRRNGPQITGPARWDGKMPLEGFQFVVDDLVGTYTFFVPKICGNIALLSREPSREAARRAEEARKAAEAKAEADRLAAEEAALRVRPFIAGYFGKQQRQYDNLDPAGLGTIRPDNVVPAFGDQLFGLKGGIQYGNQGFYFAPAIGVGFNLDESDRTSVFADGEVGYRFVRARGVQLGTGLTLWDFNHSNADSVTLGWLGTAHFPLVGTAKQNQLQFSVEWRQFFDRMSDPDVNYQFWGGLRFLFR